jgi:UDP-N-acetylmuramoyl-tripeptide--D-alanyl-D-alanine ligase
LENYVPTNSRSQFVETEHNHLIVDAYNANPSSMMAALENFSQIEAPHKMLILGDMRELGEASQEEHQRIANYISTMQVDEVWLVGEEFAKADHPFRSFSDVEAVKAELAAHRPEGRLILVKGSNGTRLYQLPALL